MIKVKFKYSKLNKLGYYSTRKSVQDIDNKIDILDGMKKWGESHSQIQNACPFEVDPANGNYGVYFCGMAKGASNDYVLALWNEAPNLKGNVVGLRGSDAPGKAQINKKLGRKGYIPGYPSYYWIVPNENILVHLYVDDMPAGASHLKTFVKAYLANKSENCVFQKQSSGSIEIEGFSIDGGPMPDEEHTFLRPEFTSSRIYKDEILADIIRRQPDISSVIKKETLHYSKLHQRSSIESFFRNMIPGTNIRGGQLEGRAITHSLKYKPSKGEIKMMYSRFKEELNKLPEQREVDNVGFRFSDRSSLFFKDSLAKIETDLKVNHGSNSLIEPIDFLNKLTSKKNDFLRPVR